jgi:aspartate aminotransferase-like enzyme
MRNIEVHNCAKYAKKQIIHNKFPADVIYTEGLEEPNKRTRDTREMTPKRLCELQLEFHVDSTSEMMLNTVPPHGLEQDEIKFEAHKL